MLKREEFAVVLDFMPYGKSGEAKKEPVAQVIGETFFTLLEVVVKKQVEIAIGEKVYIGKGVRDKIDYIKGRIYFNELTSTAQKEVEQIIKKTVVARENEFITFLNRAGAINIRLHSLELLPSIGKKHLNTILSEREKTAFKSFQEVQERVPHLGKVEEIFVQRILEELKGVSKYYLFTKPPAYVTEF